MASIDDHDIKVKKDPSSNQSWLSNSLSRSNEGTSVPSTPTLLPQGSSRPANCVQGSFNSSNPNSSSSSLNYSSVISNPGNTTTTFTNDSSNNSKRRAWSKQNKQQSLTSSSSNTNIHSSYYNSSEHISSTSNDLSVKPTRVTFDSPQTKPQAVHPRNFKETKGEANTLSSSAPSLISAYHARSYSNSRKKSKSQLNLIAMVSQSGTGGPSNSSSPSFSKRRETISHSPNISSGVPSTPTNGSSAHLGNANTSNPPSASNMGTPSGTGYRFYAQEKVYLKKIQHDTTDDYSYKPLGNTIVPSDVDSDSDDDMLPREAMGLGGVGTSFDDEYTDNVTSYPFLEASYNHEEMENDESLPERLEWQAMLASVLTGEVVRSEKRRLNTSTDAAMKEDDLWLDIRARMCGRSFEDQKRVIEDARANMEVTLQEIRQFRVTNSLDLELTLKEVNDTLLKLEYCEQLWQSTQIMKSNSALYRDPTFQRHVEALTTWATITEWIFREIHLLQLWTGNEATDPTLPPDSCKQSPMIEATSLVERVLKQEDLMKVFDEKIKSNIGPVIERAREGHLQFREEFNLIGLPVYVEGLEKLMKFPIKLIQEIVSLRLVYAKRMTNPTMMVVDQMIEDLSLYMHIALLVKERNAEYTLPVPDIKWITYKPDQLFDKTVLDCVVFFFELSQSKFVDTSPAQAHRGFKEIDKLESQYYFLEQVGRYVEGGEIVVAIQSW